MQGKGIKARTGDNETSGLALSGSFYSTCDYERIPQAPLVPSADYRHDIAAGASVKAATWPAIFAAARKANTARARVLLENYSHVSRGASLEERAEAFANMLRVHGVTTFVTVDASRLSLGG